MEEILMWVKNVVGSLCILELLYHVVQNAEYQKYLRFFGSLVFLLIVLEPMMGFVGVKEVFEKTFETVSLESQIRLGEEKAAAFGELQNQQVIKSYIGELERQIESVVTLCGQVPAGEKITLDPQGQCDIQKIQVWFWARTDDAEVQQVSQKIRTEISSLYGLKKEQIAVTAKE